MASNLPDIFFTEDAREILKNKFVLMIGDSVIRSMYKDLVKLLQTDEHLTEAQLKNKGEYNFENDELIEGGRRGEMNNDITYSEVREFKTEFNMIRFYFITRCYSDYLMSIVEDIKIEPEKPDLVIMNSGCWDITRYGPNSMREYKENLPLGIFSLIKALPSYTVFLWTTTLPVSNDVKGGFMIPECESKKTKLREDILIANRYAYLVMNEFKLDVLDLHYYFLKHTKHRAKDGIHWDAMVHRRISGMILNHVSKVWDIDTPASLRVKKDPKILDPTQVELELEQDFDEQYDINYLYKEFSEEDNSRDEWGNNKRTDLNNNNNNSGAVPLMSVRPNPVFQAHNQAIQNFIYQQNFQAFFAMPIFQQAIAMQLQNIRNINNNNNNNNFARKY